VFIYVNIYQCTCLCSCIGGGDVALFNQIYSCELCVCICMYVCMYVCTYICGGDVALFNQIAKEMVAEVLPGQVESLESAIHVSYVCVYICKYISMYMFMYLYRWR
jgi:hypothetical protein